MSFFAARSLDDWKRGPLAGDSTAISVGNFDGLHLGHQKILASLVDEARTKGLRAVVITFDPHPLKVLRPDAAPALIETLDLRLAGFARLGLDAALVLRFDAALANVSPEDFLERILVKAMRARQILVGANFRFGHNHAGDVRLLEKMGVAKGFAVQIVDAVQMDGAAVSSTRVRQAIAAGDVREAARLIGRPFALAGKIRNGDGRGSKMVFPTLNLDTEQELLPANGVYATRVELCGLAYDSVTNVGVRPTFGGQAVTVESHLLKFNEGVASGRMEVQFIERLRAEQKFESAAALKSQIARDIDAARQILLARTSA